MEKFERSQINGVFVAFKPTALTSNALLKKVKSLLPGCKVGHGGTLDPMAEGVLPVFINRATRLARFYLHSDKEYEGAIRFGWATDTFDAEGQPVSTPILPDFTSEDLIQWVTGLRGRYRQKIPPFSAAKWKGKPFYHYARRGVPCPPIEKEIEIYEIDAIQWEAPILKLWIHCSGGTYIRSIAQALGEKSGCGAHLTALRRLRSGPFSLDQAVNIENMASCPNGIREHVIPLANLLTDLPAIICNKELQCRALNGQDLEGELATPGVPNEFVRLLSSSGDLLGIGQLLQAPGVRAMVHPEIILKDIGTDA